MIVESPSKGKTIAKYLGKDFQLMSSQGHIRDIEGIGKNSMGIDFSNGYTPNYVIDKDKEQLVASLRKEALKADKVWLASDPDREGEAIAWHIQEVLQLPKEKVCRITFNDTTKESILEAINHPRDIDYNLVNAQQARRVMDRIVGFELSPVLWKKVITGLSAGRVQSVAVKLVVDREKEIENFKPDVIHAQHIWIISSIACKYDIPTVVTSHGTDIIGIQKGDKYRKQAEFVIEKAKKIIAESNPKEKDIIIDLVMNFLNN